MSIDLSLFPSTRTFPHTIIIRRNFFTVQYSHPETLLAIHVLTKKSIVSVNYNISEHLHSKFLIKIKLQS